MRIADSGAWGSRIPIPCRSPLALRPESESGIPPLSDQCKGGRSLRCPFAPNALLPLVPSLAPDNALLHQGPLPLASFLVRLPPPIVACLLDPDPAVQCLLLRNGAGLEAPEENGDACNQERGEAHGPSALPQGALDGAPESSRPSA